MAPLYANRRQSRVVIEIVATVLGFSGITGKAANVVLSMLFVFLVLAVISFLTGQHGAT